MPRVFHSNKLESAHTAHILIALVPLQQRYMEHRIQGTRLRHYQVALHTHAPRATALTLVNATRATALHTHSQCITWQDCETCTK